MSRDPTDPDDTDTPVETPVPTPDTLPMGIKRRRVRTAMSDDDRAMIGRNRDGRAFESRPTTPMPGVPIVDAGEPDAFEVTPRPHFIDPVHARIWEHADRQAKRAMDRLLEIQQGFDPDHKRLDELDRRLDELVKAGVVDHGADGNNGRIGANAQAIKSLRGILVGVLLAVVGGAGAIYSAVDSSSQRQGATEVRLRYLEEQVRAIDRKLEARPIYTPPAAKEPTP